MSYTQSNIPVRAPPIQSDYELIDGDPYFGRVVSYFRPSDYLKWGISTAIVPLGIQLWERLEPSLGKGMKPSPISGTTYRAATAIGFFGGFFLAYIHSSQRFLGWSENKREVTKDRYEIKKLLSQGKLPYHENESVLDDRNKDIANRNSQYSSTFLFIMPWFNLAYHPYHQVNLQRYYETRPGEENWGFNLKPLDEIYAKYEKKVE
ncbi:NUXM [Candida pseudojiufengensis]|uniref:NUXM n=1 Tax=Candida pseudojiufengensis TaxID=497109 RepID=UPI0022246D8D|nr:NUXM [Candida pseudojiufengensis]KAI5961907.1 NUXM [Candida pseudojiufengensis]